MGTISLVKTTDSLSPNWRGNCGAQHLADPAAFDIVINAISLGLHGQGPLPVEVAQLSGTALVTEVVMVPELTPLLQAAQTHGLAIVRGREMATQQGEGVADFFGWPV